MVGLAAVGSGEWLDVIVGRFWFLDWRVIPDEQAHPNLLGNEAGRTIKILLLDDSVVNEHINTQTGNLLAPRF